MLAALGSAGCHDPVEIPTMEDLAITEILPEIAACTDSSDREHGLVSRAGSTGSERTALRVDTMATGLAVPWDIVFLDDGRALFTERAGRIRVMSADGTLDPLAWAELPIYAQEEIGLMGIDARPTPDGGVEVFVSATYRSSSGGTVERVLGGAWRRVVRRLDPERGHPTTLHVLRLREVDGRGGAPEVLVEGIPAFMLHGGGALRLGPDDLLYVANGDAAAPWTAHDPRSLRGKILRYDTEGRPRGVIPGAATPVYAMGVRHVQGLTWEPESGQLFAIDHGPTGMEQEGYRGNRDELNAVGPGDHLGWPVATGTTVGGPFVSALMTWVPAIAPGGLDLYAGSADAWRGSAFVAGLRGETLRRLELERDGSGSWSVGCEEVVLSREYGRLRLVRTAPDGTIWIGSSNADGRGVPRAEGDMLLRLHPPTAVAP